MAVRLSYEHAPEALVRLSARMPAIRTIAVPGPGSSDALEARLLRVYAELGADLAETVRVFSEWWRPLDSRWRACLEEFMGLAWPEQAGTIVASVGVGQVCPRDLPSRRFHVPLNSSRERVLNVCAHETSHFFFYEKVASLIPPADRLLVHRSARLWLLSELLVPMLFATDESRAILGEQPVHSYVAEGRAIDACRGLVLGRPRSERSFATLLRELVRLEPAMREAATPSARALARDDPSWPRIAEALLDHRLGQR